MILNKQNLKYFQEIKKENLIDHIKKKLNIFKSLEKKRLGKGAKRILNIFYLNVIYVYRKGQNNSSNEINRVISGYNFLLEILKKIKTFDKFLHCVKDIGKCARPSYKVPSL